MYMHKDIIEDKLYQRMDQCIEGEITPIKFYSKLLKEIHSFCDGNGRTSNILFANDETKKNEMHLCCIICLKFTKYNNIKIDDRINFYSSCIDCNFKKELSDLLKVQTIYKTMLLYRLKCRKSRW